MADWNKLFNLSFGSALLIFATTAGIYFTVIFFTRIFGKRSFSKISSFDFAMTIAVGSLIASTILSDTVSLLEGIVAAAAIYLLQLTLAYFRRFAVIKKIIDNKPTLLMDGPNFLVQNMKDVRVTEGDIRSKLREANVKKLNEVKAVIFETTGNIVVIHSEDDIEIEDWLLKDVKR